MTKKQDKAYHIVLNLTFFDNDVKWLESEQLRLPFNQ
jgi:hypothetical protein